MNALLCLALAASAAGPYPPKEQREYLYPYDLGPAAIDASGYPAERRASYPLFAKTCSQCHTLARAINSPLISREQWAPFVDRMHLRAAGRPWSDFTPEEAAAILDFLVHDSRVRKVERAKEFEARGRRLRELFERVRAERERR
jgi:hypothetical protein